VASIRRRSLRRIGNYVSRLDYRVRRISKKPAPSRIGSRVVTSQNIQEGAVDSSVLDSSIVSDIDNANSTAVTALSTANGKNKAFYQSTAPTATAIGDIWFDTGDDNRIRRWDGSVWAENALGDNALTSLSANKITAGTIDASQITVSNIDAGNITVGTLNGIAINIGSGASSFHVDSSGNMWLGSNDFSSAPFRVSREGDIYAVSGQIASIDIKLKAELSAQYQDFASVAALANASSFSAGGDETNSSVSGVLIGDTGRSVFTEVNTPKVGALNNSYIEFGNLGRIRYPNAINPVGTLSIKNIVYRPGAPSTPQPGDIWLRS
jgi:hypothetical protein